MNCPVCLNPSTVPAFAGSDTLFEMTPQEFNLQSCAACHSLFLNPMPSPGEISGFYPSQYWWSAARPGFLKRLEAIYRKIALRDHIHFIMTALSGSPNGQRLLDVGCGSGTLIGLLKKRGLSVLGIDTSEEASQVAARESEVRVIVGTLDQAAFGISLFDVVTMFHVIEHVTNPREVLGEVQRILKPGGILIAQVPNIDSWQFRWFGAKWYGLDVPRHVIDYSQQSIVKLLEDTGFSVRRIRQFNLRDNAPALVSSLFLTLDPLSRRIRLHHRNATERSVASWAKHLAYLFLVLLAYPVVILEAAAGHGATVMIDARRRS
jgi:2-polyprenyl-3-methyl-5-hydroxy-6-metoxy-1,4-benzoquinol methylase